ncbi:GntR family transcriptional regulator [Actinopolymorpha alba]|uniref:GntR family transcriptional regulator n=1 Tax=Actinopolymorpha alba TaxID=533267 RepID=UPI00037B79C7|nr:GntR family transcriptional regulator [Actinopolymorpha alba]
MAERSNSERKQTPRARVPKRTLASVVTSQIRDRIIDGTYPPGTQMNEVELANRFATSRGPVREGMQRLVQEGLLVSTPHRGIFVPVLTADDLDDLYFARAAIERAALLRLTERGAPAGLLADLEQALGMMALALEEQAWPRVSAADLRFHELIVYAADSPRLSQMYASLAGQTRLGLNLLVDTYQGREDLLDEHSDLFKLLAAGDRRRLLETLDKHFDDALKTFESTYTPSRSRPRQR